MRSKSTDFLNRTCEQCGTLFHSTPSRLAYRSARFCSRPCANANGMRLNRRTPAEILWSKVQKSDDPDACWPRSGFLNANGQNSLIIDGHRIIASRLAWILTVGPIPEGFDVCHTCDRPACCRNDEEGFYEIGGILRPRRGHLWLGTPAENSLDMALKGRSTLGRARPYQRGDRNPSRLYPERLKRGDESWQRQHPELIARGDRNGSYTKPERRPRGEAHGNTSLTAEQVAEMRRLRTEERLPLSELARRFGMSKSGVGSIIRGETWREPTAVSRP